jgi:hypothetical protein
MACVSYESAFSNKRLKRRFLGFETTAAFFPHLMMPLLFATVCVRRKPVHRQVPAVGQNM